jgi:hypothetical protein
MARRIVRSRPASRRRLLHVEPLEDRRLLNAGGLSGVTQILGAYAPPSPMAGQHGPGFQPWGPCPPVVAFPIVTAHGTPWLVFGPGFGFKPYHPPAHGWAHHVVWQHQATDVDNWAAEAAVQATAYRLKDWPPRRDTSADSRQGGPDYGTACDVTPVADPSDTGGTGDSLSADAGDGGTDTSAAAPQSLPPGPAMAATGQPDGRATANVLIARVLARVGAEAEKGLAGLGGDSPTAVADIERAGSPAAPLAEAANPFNPRGGGLTVGPLDHTLALTADSPMAGPALAWAADQVQVDGGVVVLTAADADVAAPAVAGVADAVDPAGALPAGLSRQADLIAGFLPVDAPAIERAVQDFLGQVEQVGGDSAHLLTRLGVPPWVLATVIGTTACGLSWRRRKGRTEVVLQAPPGDDDTTSTCLPGSAGGLAAEDA